MTADTDEKKPSKIPITYRPYDFPTQFSVISFFGQNWQVTLTRPDHLHFHNCFELGRCLSGSGTLCLGDRRLPFKKGDYSVINPLEPHMAVCSGEPSSWEYIYFDPLMLFHGSIPAMNICRSFYPSDSPSLIAAEASCPALCNLLSQLYAEFHEKQAFYPYAIQALLISILAELKRLPKDTLCSSSLTAGTDSSIKAVQTALIYIFTHYSSDFSMSELAAHCCLSVSRFRRVFSEATGRSPLEYLQHYRIQNACHLLQGKSSIAEIASLVGCRTLSSFNRQFRQYTGCSPSEWRKQHMQNFALQNIASLSDSETAAVFRY